MRLALVVIARDEAPRIRRLLDSVRPWVDEMLVLDTGSTDATVEIARAAGARVEQGLWRDDFAAARNEALALADADWHLVLDADEWLEQGGDALRQAAQLAADYVGCLNLCDHFEADGHVAQASQWLSRLLPGPVRYVGLVHEQPRHSLPLRRLDVLIGHDGYAPARLAAKRGRNRLLLRHALSESPDDAYLWYQLGKDCSVYDEHEDAELAFERAVSFATSQPSWWLDLATRRLFGLKCLGLHKEGMAFAESQLAACADSPDFFFALGDLLLDQAAKHSSDALPMAEQAWRRCLDLGERPDQVGAVAGRGSRLAAYNLTLILDGTGRADEAAALRAAYIL